jgi:hypothetical protein
MQTIFEGFSLGVFWGSALTAFFVMGFPGLIFIRVFLVLLVREIRKK